MRTQALLRHRGAFLRELASGVIDAVEPVGGVGPEALHDAAALVDQGAEAARVERGSQILHLATLRADPWQQQPGVRQQRAQPRELPGQVAPTTAPTGE